MNWAFLLLAAGLGTTEIESLWSAEGETLRALVEVSEGEEAGDVLLRLGIWHRESARKTEESTVAERHLDSADEAFERAIALIARESLPVALYSLGDLRRARGRTREAQEHLARLLNEFPETPLAIDAAIALGDDAFDEARLAEAVENYEFAIERAPEGDGLAWARYKLAWCRLNLTEFAEARALLAKVASRNEGSSLVQEARRDYVIALARDASVEMKEALDAIDAISGDESLARRLGEGWATLVAESGRDEEAAAAYERLLKGARVADASRMLAAALGIAIRRRAQGEVMQLSRRLADLAEAYPDESKDSRVEAERALRTAVITLHGEGRAAGDLERMTDAATLYADYFRAFSTEAQAYELHHHAGELLLSLKRPAEAERHYTAAVSIDLARVDAGEEPGKWLHSAARGAVLAAQELIDPNAESAPPILPTERVLVAACDRYLRLLPGGEHAVEVAFQRGLLLYRRHEFDDAITALRAIAIEHSTAEVAAPAAEAALDALKQLGRWDALASLAKELSKKAPLASRIGGYLNEVREAALLTAAEERAQAGAHEDAARRYLEVEAEFGSGPRVERALYNAASSLAVSGRLEEAVRVRARLIAQNGKGEFLTRALERQTEDLVRLGRFSEARDALLSLVEKGPGKGAERLSEAILYAEAAGERAQARTLRERYLKEHARGKDSFAHALELAASTKGCIPSMRAHRQAVRRAKTAAEKVVALSETVRAELACNEPWWAAKHAQEALAIERRTKIEEPAALDALAMAALELAREKLKAFRRIQLRAPYQKTIPKKLAALEQAEGALAKVIERGRADAAICALVDSGLAWAELSRTLSAVRAPRSFTEEQRLLFEEELSAQAQPLGDRARTTLEEALHRARISSRPSSCLSPAIEELAMLSPEQYAPRLETWPALSPGVEADDSQPEEILAASPDAPAAAIVAARRELTRQRPRAALLLLSRIEEKDPLAAVAEPIRLAAMRAAGLETEARLRLHALAPKVDSEWAWAAIADDALASRDFLRARDALGRLAAMRSNDVSVLLASGISARALGEVTLSLELYEAALEIDAEREDVHLALGLLLCAEANKPKEGLLHLEKAASNRSVDAARAACAALAGEKR